MTTMSLAEFYALPFTGRPVVRKGDRVAWNRSKIVAPNNSPVVVGRVVRVARDGTWADIEWDTPGDEMSDLARAWDIRTSKARVSLSNTRLVPFSTMRATRVNG